MIDKKNTFVFHVAIDPVAIFGDELTVRVERVADLDATVVKELPQPLLLLEQPGKRYLRLSARALAGNPGDLSIASSQSPFLEHLALRQVLKGIDAVWPPTKFRGRIRVFFTYVHKHGTVRPAPQKQHNDILPTVLYEFVPVSPKRLVWGLSGIKPERFLRQGFLLFLT
jgi:hypothetical protein